MTQIRNQIVNYFASLPTKKNKTRVFKAPVSMNSETALTLLKEQDKTFDAKYLLHVCYDEDSGRIYIINKEFFTKDQFEILLRTVEEKIKKNYDLISSDPIIYGSPFSSLRVRNLDSFQYVKKVVDEELDGKSIDKIPIIEVNLNRMPKLAKALPERFKNGMVLGGYISPSETKGFHFYEEVDINGKIINKPEKLLSQKTPFIFINIGSDPSAPEKEWHVLNGYREYFSDKSIFNNIKQEHSDAFLFAIKRFFKLGWTFEEVSDIFIKNICNLFDLVSSANELMKICKSYEDDGYENPAAIPYYVTFKIDNKFPINLDSMIINGGFSSEKQLPWFRIIDFNPNTKYITIETPVFVREKIWRETFKAITSPLITRYNKHTNTIDVKSEDHSYSSLKKGEKNVQIQLSKIILFSKSEAGKIYPEKIDKIDFRNDNNSRSIKAGDGNSFHLRDIVDYHEACEQLRKFADNRNIEFENINIVIGPLERLFGSGTRGGFMDEKCFKDAKMETPYEITKGIFVKPPLIAIDTKEMPTPAEQASTLVHEYCHNLFHIEHPEYKNKYHGDPTLKETDSKKYWYLYLTDEDERQAHSEQVKFELRSGKSIDELIRNKVGGQVTPENYHIAILFKDIINMATKEMEEEYE